MGAFLFREFGKECPETEIRPSLGVGGHKLASLLRYGENPNQSRWKDTVKPVRAENPDGVGFFSLQYERVPHGTRSIRPSVRPATVP